MKLPINVVTTVLEEIVSARDSFIELNDDHFVIKVDYTSIDKEDDLGINLEHAKYGLSVHKRQVLCGVELFKVNDAEMYKLQLVTQGYITLQDIMFQTYKEANTMRVALIEYMLCKSK